MSASLSDQFCNRFHIGKVQRKPLRNDITRLLVRAEKLPKDDASKPVVAEIKRAWAEIFAKARTNEARQISVNTAKTIYDTELPKVIQLEAKMTATTVKTKTATKEDTARAAALAKSLDELAKAIDVAFTPEKARPSVMMPEALTRFALSGQVESIRLQIRSSIVTEKLNASFTTEIDAVKAELDKARKFADDTRASVAVHEKLVEEGYEVLKKLNKSLGADALKSPLGQKLQALQSALHPEMLLLNASEIENLADSLQSEIDGLGNIDDYSDAAATQIRRQGRADGYVELFDDTVNAPMEALRVLTEALDPEAYRQLNVEVADMRAKLAKPTPKNKELDAKAEAAAMLKKITAASDAARDNAKRLQKAVMDLRQQLDSAIQSVASTKTAVVFAADWKQINAMMESISRLMPQQSDLTGQTLANLAAAEPLTKTVLELVRDISAGKDALAGFDKQLAELEKKTAEVDKNDPWPDYFPDEWKKYTAALEKFKKDLPATKATVAAAALTKLRKEFDDNLLKAKTLGDFITHDVVPVWQAKYQLFMPLLLQGADIPTPSAQQVPMDAISDELRKKPPNRANLEKSLKELNDAFKGLESPDDLMTAATKSHAAAKADAKQQKEASKALRKPLQDRLSELKQQFSHVEALVSEQNGDKNPVKQLERRLEQADAEIDAVDAKNSAETVGKATKTLERIAGRIDLVVEHPEGEAGRKRKEIPALYDALRKARADGSTALDALKLKVDGYRPDGKANKKMRDGARALGKRIEDFRDSYAKPRGILRHLIGTLTDDDQPEQARRKAREAALGALGDMQRGLQSHPMTRLLMEAPDAAVKMVPRRLLSCLDRLYFTILTCVE